MNESTEINSEKKTINKQPYKIASLIACALLFFILPIASLQVGIPGDEPIDAQYGIASLNFYKSFGKDTSFVNLTALNHQTFPYQKYYGALFETYSIFIANLSGTPLYKTRHVLIAICGALIILLTALFVAELSGWRPAFISVLLLASSPTFIGNSYFNSKDIPMAMGFILAMYFFVKLIKQLPHYHKTTIAGCIAGIACTIGVRIGGLMLLGYLVVFLLYYIADNDSIRNQLLASVKKSFILFFLILFICITGFLLGLFSYPNFFLHGMHHISESMAVAKKFPIKILMLFRGEMIYANEIGWDYLPVCMGLTFPLTVIAGFIFYFINFIKNIKKISWQQFILVYSVLFLFVYIIITHQYIYNGWRHVLFIYPVIVSMAAIAFIEIYSEVKKYLFRALLLLFFFGMSLKTVFWMYVNHPYEYIYFNELAGGVKGAYGNYDTDYQQLAASESYNWLLNSKVFKSDSAKNKILLTNNIALMCADKIAAAPLEIMESSFLRMNYRPMNYAILSSIYLDKTIMNNFYPPKGVIHSVYVDGAPISVVIKRENDFLLKGKFYFDHSNLDSAFIYLLKAYNYDENDFRVWPSLGHCYYLKGYSNLAIDIVNRYLHYFPDDVMGKRELEFIHAKADSATNSSSVN